LPDIICDTSAIQYLYQLELLHILPKLADRVLVPPAVMDEIEVGRAAGVPLPDLADLDWVIVQRPVSVAAVPLLTDLGPGEAEVLMLAIEQKQVVAVLDDALARRIADTLDLPFTGTLGLLLDAKQAGLVPAVSPLLDRLQALRFRLAPDTRQLILKLAGEETNP
jgi:predicted nucleic acid-binding protein